MESLPFELIKLVLCHTFEADAHGASHLSKALRVCKRWNAAGRDIFWNTIVLNDTNIARFLRGASASHRGMIRDLTLSANSMRSAKQRRARKKAMRDALVNASGPLSPSAFKRMVSNTNKLTHLATVSLFDSGLKDADKENARPLSHTRIERFLDNLPISVENLELDIRQHDDTDLEAQNCLCPTIARIIPRLKHVRLRLPKLCPSLLVPSPNLQSFIINVSWVSMYNTCGCHRSDSTNTSERVSRVPDDDRTLFIRSVCSRLDKQPQLLPSIEKFLLMSTYNLDEDWCGPSHVQLKDDLIKRQTTSIPLWCVNEEAPLADELWALRVLESSDPERRDIVGPSDVIDTYLEESPWSHNIRGGRYISNYSKGTRHHSIMTPSEYEKSKMSIFYSQDCGVWSHEAETQDCLLAPQTFTLKERRVLDMEGFCHYGSIICSHPDAHYIPDDDDTHDGESANNDPETQEDENVRT